MNQADVRRQVAEAAAQQLRADTMLRIGLVLDDHMKTLVDFMCEMQQRLDSADELLRQVSLATLETELRGRRSYRLPLDLMNKIDALLASEKARNDDGNDT